MFGSRKNVYSHAVDALSGDRMAIDHGLGGKETQKNKEKRKKKADKRAALARTALKIGKKGRKEVVFDEDARVKWLTGFGKRKQERRKYGHAMEVC